MKPRFLEMKPGKSVMKSASLGMEKVCFDWRTLCFRGRAEILGTWLRRFLLFSPPHSFPLPNRWGEGVSPRSVPKTDPSSAEAAFPKSVPNWVFFISVHSCSLVVNRVLVAAQPALRCIAGFQPARRFAGSKAPELGTLCRLEIGPNCPRNGGLSNHLSSLESDVLKTPARERRRGALPLSQK